jgi:hypothetical protein
MFRFAQHDIFPKGERVILREAKNLESFLPSAMGGYRTLAAALSHPSDRAIADSFAQ